MMLVLLLLVLAVVLAVVLGAGGPMGATRYVRRPRPPVVEEPVVEEIVYDDRVIDERREVVEEVIEEVPARRVAPVTRRRRRIVEY